MTYQQFAVSRQLIAEERTGRAARKELSAEDAAFAQSAKALQQVKVDGVRRHR